MRADLGCVIRRAAVILACLLGTLASAQAADAGFDGLEHLTLKQAETLMARYNRDILTAQRQLEVVQAERIIAGQRPNPTFSYDASSISPSQGIGAGSLRDKNIEQTVRLEQTFERGNKRGLRVEQASHNESASRADRINTVRQQRLALRSAYFDLLLAQERQNILREMADLFNRSQDVAERRLRAGDISKVEAARIRIDALRAAGDLGLAEADLARARLALAALIGAEGRALGIRAVDPWPDYAAQGTVSDLDAAIAARPDVRAAQARLLASEAGRRLARSARVRDVTVGAEYKHFPFNPELGTGSGNTVGVTVSVPLFVWHANEGEIRRSEAEHAATEVALDKVRAAARLDLERAWSDLVQAGLRVERFQQRLLQDAAAAAEAVEFAYRQGAVGVTDLLDARRTYRATQLDAAAARSDYAKALAAWQLAIAGESASDAALSN
jgi:cobalt-zinc-cadmium efflux system outer membrane protein